MCDASAAASSNPAVSPTPFPNSGSKPFRLISGKFGRDQMAKYRTKLPQLTGSVFLTDGGIETSLIFLDGIELPYFAAFDLLKSEEGRSALRNYYSPYAQLAKD